MTSYGPRRFAVVDGIERHLIFHPPNGAACDHEGCGAEIAWPRHNPMGGSIAAELAAQGWTMWGEETFCPIHPLA